MLNASFIDTNTPPVGENVRMDCPNCGGRSTFTINNIGGTVFWNCYRASCGVRGGRNVDVSTSDILKMQQKERERQNFTLPATIVPARDVVYEWAKKYGLDADALDLMYDVADPRVVFPIHDHNSVMVDAIGRALRDNSYVKWKRYGNHTSPYTCGDGQVAVVVEDATSAAVAGTHVECATGVALLGTSLTNACKNYIINHKFAGVIVALDPDAIQKTLVMHKELTTYVHTQVLSLRDDLKYRDKLDMQNLREMTNEIACTDNHRV